MKTFAYLILLAILIGCSDDQTPAPVNTTQPEIISLESDKMEIGIGEIAELTCVATGGDLTYEWLVALGDIIPVSTDGSVVQFSGAACCSGSQTIGCKVTNNKGSDEEIITIILKEE